jgi:hypothetical protein
VELARVGPLGGKSLDGCGVGDLVVTYGVVFEVVLGEVDGRYQCAHVGIESYGRDCKLQGSIY